MGVVIGVLVGAGFVESFHHVTDRRGRERFEMTMKCKRLADTLAKEKSNEYRQFEVNEVRFSAARNQCIASIDEASRVPPAATLWRFTVVDVLSGELLFSDMCDEDKRAPISCGAEGTGKLRAKRDQAFRDAVN